MAPTRAARSRLRALRWTTRARRPDGRLLAGPDEFNPSFIADWEGMDPEEYAASLPDIPDHILDAAPEDDLPEHIRMAWHLADAARMPDPLTDPPGQARAVAELAKRRVLTGGEAELGFFVDELALALTCTRYAAWAKLHTALDSTRRPAAVLTAPRSGRERTAGVRAASCRDATVSAILKPDDRDLA